MVDRVALLAVHAGLNVLIALVVKVNREAARQVKDKETAFRSGGYVRHAYVIFMHVELT